MLDTLYSQIGLLPMVLVGIFAFTKGDEPERLAMGAYLLGWMAGMLIYPQVCSQEYQEPRGSRKLTGTDGYLARVGNWLKTSF